ncbi:hypothetical protein HanPSC8_Chr10g0435841 [Helianthus annuus]|nr:hypothetical protein HanPSC8_Chr10g0435841 [Helianthus annuus]
MHWLLSYGSSIISKFGSWSSCSSDFPSVSTCKLDSCSFKKANRSDQVFSSHSSRF